MNKCFPVFVVSVCGTLASVAAQFTPTAGGNIDDQANWNGSGTLAVAKQLTGPLTLSKSPASMPSGTTTLYFWNYANTCDFGAGNVLDMGTIPLSIEQNGTLRLASGKIAGNIYVNEALVGTGIGSGTLVLDGPTAVLEPTTLSFRSYQTSTGPWENKIVVTNGAKLAMGSKPFVVYGGWNAGYALITGVGSTLEATDIYMGGKYAQSTAYEGWNDHPGVRRTLEFAQNSTNAISGWVYLGCNEVMQDSVSGGNTLKVSSGAELTVGSSVVFGPSGTNEGKYVGSTNNTLLVDGGTLKVCGDILYGREALFKGNRIAVRDGGRLELTDSAATDHALQVGMAADGDFLSVEGEGSVLDIPKSKLFIGGRSPYLSCRNRVDVRDGGRIQTGVDAYLGLMGGNNNCLTLSNGAEFQTTENLYASGPTSILVVAGSTLSVSKDLLVDAAAVDSAITLGDGASLSARYLWMKSPAAFSATNATLNLQGLAFANGQTLSLTNSTLTIRANVPNSGGFGCNNGEIAFHGGSVFNVPFRWVMKGDHFTIRLDDSTLDASGIKSDWFITGQGNADGVRNFIFEGARPYLKTTSTGFYLRGTAINLVFNLGKDGFPTDRPVVDVQGSGKFAADSKSANLVSVNVDGKCPDGTYVLMNGTDAGKLLNADRYQLTVAEGRKAKLIRTDNAVSVKVWEPKGLLLILR